MLKKFNFTNYHTRLILLGILMVGVVSSMILVFVQSRQPVMEPALKVTTEVTEIQNPVEPKLTTTEVVTGLSHPWDIIFLPDNSMLFNERSGKISRYSNNQKFMVADIADVNAVGEGGLTGLALDSEFANNRYIYTCFNARTASGIDVRLVRWKLSADNKQLTDRKDIVTGIPSNVSGRHSGCRVRVDILGNLWIGTGDAAKAYNPQDPKNLGGKILHVTRDGMPAPGNLPVPYDPRIFSYGHRNVQGIVLFNSPRNNVYGYSIEHGSDVDDEINLLKNGNFGWAPKAPYIEDGVPMTDLTQFPGAVQSIWSSGQSTIAPSGGTLLKGKKWGTWNGSVAMAVLKGKHIRIMRFDNANKLIEEKKILTDFGRIRSVTQGPDGYLYFSTDNKNDDKIMKVVPRS